MKMCRRVVIFAKEPYPGRVKTRLARGIGSVAAARWFRREALALAQRLGSDPRWCVVIAVSPDVKGLKSRVWPRSMARWAQGGGDLGARMGRAFRKLPPGPVVIIGADALDVQRADIWAAFQALGSADAVLGPAVDGGYWLIGLRRTPRRAPARLFAHVRWSTEHALADTKKSLAGLRIAQLETRTDVDELADLPPADRARWAP